MVIVRIKGSHLPKAFNMQLHTEKIEGDRKEEYTDFFYKIKKKKNPYNFLI